MNPSTHQPPQRSVLTLSLVQLEVFPLASHPPPGSSGQPTAASRNLRAAQWNSCARLQCASDVVVGRSVCPPWRTPIVGLRYSLKLLRFAVQHRPESPTICGVDVACPAFEIVRLRFQARSILRSLWYSATILVVSRGPAFEMQAPRTTLSGCLPDIPQFCSVVINAVTRLETSHRGVSIACI